MNDYRFCPLCGGELKVEVGDSSKVPVCQKCGFRFYQNSKPTVSALVANDQRQVLLSKRNIEPNKGTWDIIGGFLENGEDPIKGLKREFQEELGVEIEVGDIVGIYVDEYANSSKDVFYTFNVFYRVKISKGSPKMNKEISELKWFKEEEIPWGKLSFKTTADSLKDFFKNG